MTGPAAVLVAAGRARRMGADKLWIDLWGRPVWRWSLDALLGMRELAPIVVVHPAGAEPRFRAGLPPGAEGRCRLVTGGEERIDSVLAGLYALRDAGHAQTGLVLIHDAARPAVSTGLVERVAAAAAGGGGVVPVVPIADTLKRVDGDRVVATLDRRQVGGAQTPQAGVLAKLVAALEAARRRGDVPTDDAEALAEAGVVVRAVPGETTNLKLTDPEDVPMLRAILRSRSLPLVEEGGRTGVGFDAHRLTAERPLRLAGLDWPDAARGLAGHSDGDVALHALIDALLGAAGAGDIGTLFPSEERWSGADSAELLSIAMQRVVDAGYRAAWVDLVIVAAEPAIAPRRAEVTARIGQLIGLEAASVSVKGTTSDGLGYAGREGIAAYAVAGVRRA